MYFVRNFRLKLYGPDMINVLSKPVERGEFSELIGLRNYMIDVMRKANGVGLSAPQIGLFKQFFLFEKPDGRIVSLVNPEVTRLYGKESEGLEGCLSLPPEGNECYVPRMEIVEVEASTAESPEVRRKFEFRRIPARIVQHEIDHLTGTFFIDRVSEKRRRLVLEDFNEWKRKHNSQLRRTQGAGNVDAGVVAACSGQSRLS